MTKRDDWFTPTKAISLTECREHRRSMAFESIEAICLSCQRRQIIRTVFLCISGAREFFSPASFA